MSNQPIEEKWKEEWNLMRTEVILAKESNDQEQIIDVSAMERRDIAFIENLLEQERKRMSYEVEKFMPADREVNYHSSYSEGKIDMAEKILSIINK